MRKLTGWSRLASYCYRWTCCWKRGLHQWIHWLISICFDVTCMSTVHYTLAQDYSSSITNGAILHYVMGPLVVMEPMRFYRNLTWFNTGYLTHLIQLRLAHCCSEIQKTHHIAQSSISILFFDDMGFASEVCEVLPRWSSSVQQVHSQAPKSSRHSWLKLHRLVDYVVARSLCVLYLQHNSKLSVLVLILGRVARTSLVDDLCERAKY